MNTKVKRNIRIALAVLALWAASIACDNGGTINPDNGCIGQGQSWNSCADNLNIQQEGLFK